MKRAVAYLIFILALYAVGGLFLVAGGFSLKPASKPPFMRISEIRAVFA